jgi:hypothetical protein
MEFDMRLVVMALAGVIFLSENVCASDVTPVVPENFWFHGSREDAGIDRVFIELLQNQEGGGYTTRLVTMLDEAYEKNNLGIVVNLKSDTVQLRIPYEVAVDGVTKQFTCGRNVGIGARKSYAQPQTTEDALLAFCSSMLIEPVKESVALKGFGKALTLLGGVASAGTQVITSFQSRLSREKFVELMSRPDVIAGISRIKTDVLAKEADALAKKMAYKNTLFEKGQKFIREAAVGETVCTAFDAYKVYAFIENVRGQKVQLRINRIIRVDLNGRDVKESTSIGGLTYRNGEIIWSDASLWSACQ